MSSIENLRELHSMIASSLQANPRRKIYLQGDEIDILMDGVSELLKEREERAPRPAPEVINR